MRPFIYSRAKDVPDAIALAGTDANTRFVGGGTNLLDLMKMDVEHPSKLVDINRIPLASVEEHRGGLRIGAMARNSYVSAHPLVLERYPLLSEALLAGASPQIRNMATVGGNLMQRTRCFYFYDPSYKECNKRAPGSGCAAIHGYNRMHAILGSSDHCIATYPGDMAVALTALDAQVVINSRRGERSIPIGSFYRLPGDTPQIDNELKPAELIVAVDLPGPPEHSRFHYLKVRDRNSFAFALVSAAVLVAMDTDNKRILEARIALGGVAHKPWRSHEAEQALQGKEATETVFRHAAEILVKGAKARQYNGFKVELARRCIVRALTMASEHA